MKKIRKCCVIVLLVVLFPANIFAQERRDKEQTYVLENPYEVNKITPLQGKKIKNVVLMIGDGMSLMHVYSAWTANRGKLFLDNCQAVGLSKTYCANKLITDSGAGGTAIATGQKTNYHSVGVDVEGRPLKSLVDFAVGKGKYRRYFANDHLLLLMNAPINGSLIASNIFAVLSMIPSQKAGIRIVN